MTGLKTNHSECRHVDPLLLALPDGELNPRDAAELQAHLDACPRCRAEAENQRRFRDLLRAEPLPDVALPSGMELLHRVYGQQRSAPWNSFRPAWLALGFALGLAALAVSLQLPPHSISGPRTPVEGVQAGPPPALFVMDDERTGRQVLLAPAATPAGGGS